MVVLGALLWSFAEAGLPGRDLVNPGGWIQVRSFLEAAFRPELDPRFLRLAVDASLVTLAFAVCGTALSLVIGAVGGLLGSEVWWRLLLPGRGSGRGGALRWMGGWRAPWAAVRGLLALPRAIHEIVWGLFLIAVLGLDPLVGILAIAIPFGAITAKVFSEILDETSHRPLAALRSAGVPPLQACLYGLLPQALPDLLSYAFYRFECSIRSAAVLGIIGAGGLGYQIFLSLQSLRYGEMWTFLFALLLLTGLTDLWSTALRRRLGSAHRIRVRLREAARLSWRETRNGAPKGTAPEAGVAATPAVDEPLVAGAFPGPGAPPPTRGRAVRAAEVRGAEVRGAVPAAATRAPDRAVPGAGAREAAAGEPTAGETAAGEATAAPAADPLIRASLVTGAALLVLSFWYLDAGWGKLAAPRTGALLSQVLGDAFPPALGGLALGDFFRLSADTLAMSILAMALAGAGGVLLSFPAAHSFLLPGGILNPGGRGRASSLAGTAVFTATRAFLLFLRAVPAPIWALLLLFVLFPGILPGALALGLYTWGVLGRLMAETTENLDARPLRALRGQGATGPAVFLYGVVPAAATRYASYLLYRWEVAIRATAMVGVVGAGGLGRLLQEQLTSFDYAAVATTTLFYVGLTFLVDMASARVRADLR